VYDALPMRTKPLRVLLVDLNNFARYPTVAIGMLAAVLRRDGIEVDVFSPLAIGIPGVAREGRVGRFGRLEQYLRHVTANAPIASIRALRAWAVSRRHPIGSGEVERILGAFDAALAGGYDAILVSAYLMYRDAVEALAARCASRGIPVGLGGPYFAQPEVVDAWRSIAGVSAVLGGEGESHVGAFVHALVGRAPFETLPGVSTASVRSGAAAPLGDLDALPFADYSDFPWSRYPNRLIPLVAGRGCGWGRCTFCSDVTSSMGRGFRSRRASHVLAEATHQATRHETSNFVFTDLKLNSHVGIWNALVNGMQDAVPGARWVAAVHVDRRADNGLSAPRLKAAAAAGMVRVTTGLESGSQRILDSMQKGADVSRIEAMICDAWEAGISVRLTMIVGYPGETPEDVEASAAFLERNDRYVGRVLLNRFSMITGTRIQRRLRRGIAHQDMLQDLAPDAVAAVWPHRYAGAESRAYRRALWRLLGAAHRINRRPLHLSATAFEGVM
jgi:anaerobic magnesium-protoporphyrin IX monomethyl ester cyclase